MKATYTIGVMCPICSYAMLEEWSQSPQRRAMCVNVECSEYQKQYRYELPTVDLVECV